MCIRDRDITLFSFITHTKGEKLPFILAECKIFIKPLHKFTAGIAEHFESDDEPKELCRKQLRYMKDFFN